MLNGRHCVHTVAREKICQFLSPKIKLPGFRGYRSNKRRWTPVLESTASGALGTGWNYLVLTARWPPVLPSLMDSWTISSFNTHSFPETQTPLCVRTEQERRENENVWKGETEMHTHREPSKLAVTLPLVRGLGREEFIPSKERADLFPKKIQLKNRSLDYN